jgi:hypothetical protein
MVLRDGIGYRERHGKGTLIPCFIMLIVLSLAIYAIVDYGLNSDRTNDDDTPDGYRMFYELYSEEYNLTGRLTVYDDFDSIYEVLEVFSDGSISSAKMYPVGTYNVYYAGTDNDVAFGPVEFQVQGPDSLLVDRQIVSDIRLTVSVL